MLGPLLGDGSYSNPLEFVDKNYVDSLANGVKWKQVVRLATATTLPANTYTSGGLGGVGDFIECDAVGALSVDGVAAGIAGLGMMGVVYFVIFMGLVLGVVAAFLKWRQV